MTSQAKWLSSQPHIFLPQISRQQAQHTPGPTFTLASSSQIFTYTQLPRPPLWLISLAHASLRFPETTSLGCGTSLSTDRDEVPRSRVTKRRKVGERESNPAYGPRVAYLESVQELPLGVWAIMTQLRTTVVLIQRSEVGYNLRSWPTSPCHCMIFFISVSIVPAFSDTFVHFPCTSVEGVGNHLRFGNQVVLLRQMG